MALNLEKSKIFSRYLYPMPFFTYLIPLLFLFSSATQASRGVVNGGAPPPISPRQDVDDLIGKWDGVLLQDPGGIAPRFDMSMTVYRQGMSVVGTTFVTYQGIWVEMAFSGYRQPNGTFKIIETEILRGVKPEDLAWCMKRFELTLSYTREGWVLLGPWWGNSGYGECIPGSIRLRKRWPHV